MQRNLTDFMLQFTTANQFNSYPHSNVMLKLDMSCPTKMEMQRKLKNKKL